METVKTIAIVILALVAGKVAYDNYQTRNFVAPEAVDEMVDEHTRVTSALTRDKQDIERQLREFSEAAADRIAELEEEILIYAETSARLRAERDSLEAQWQDVPSDWFAVYEETVSREESVRIDPLPAPTRLSFRETFNNSLYACTSEVWVEGGRLYNDLDSEWLRDLRWSTTVTEGDAGQLLIYVSAPELDISYQEAFTPRGMKGPERAWYIRYWRELVIGGLGAAVVLR